jgi:putative IMPACT (imprinted ancient) family translation regulator
MTLTDRYILHTNDYRYVEEEFEDTKVIIRIRISEKNIQNNGQKKKYKRTNNDLQNIHIKLKIE